jgi:hypothetical protein
MWATPEMAGFRDHCLTDPARQEAGSSRGRPLIEGTVDDMQLESQTLTRGRPTKFTPERIQQICNLVERGKSRDEIATIIGVPTSSLQVTCSKLGISLRRPIFDLGTRVLTQRRSAHRHQRVASSHQSRSKTELVPKAPQSASGAKPVAEGQVEVQGPAAYQRKIDDETTAVFAIRMEYKGQERTTGLPFDDEMIRQLALEAEIRGMRIGELVSALIIAIVKNDLFPLMRDHADPHPHPQSPEGQPCSVEEGPSRASAHED